MTTAPKPGRFITFEGGEGVGKSTQVACLAERLENAGICTVTTREPGGSPFAERLRAFILDPETPPHQPLAEALLFSAARADHLETVIRPNMRAGSWVLCDRFMDSTRAYQGAAGGMSPAIVDQLEAIVVCDTRPDLTIILDLPVDMAFERVRSRASGSAPAGTGQTDDPYEARDRQFHERLRQGFLDIASAEPARCAVIDASASPETIADAAWQIVADRLTPGGH